MERSALTVEEVTLFADELFEIFEDNCNYCDHEDIHFISGPAMQDMVDVFEACPLTSRAEVFVKFLELLKEGGFKYDINQFVEGTMGTKQ